MVAVREDPLNKVHETDQLLPITHKRSPSRSDEVLLVVHNRGQGCWSDLIRIFPEHSDAFNNLIAIDFALPNEVFDKFLGTF